jgi:hypothetical protein
VETDQRWVPGDEWCRVLPSLISSLNFRHQNRTRIYSTQPVIDSKMPVETTSETYTWSAYIINWCRKSSVQTLWKPWTVGANSPVLDTRLWWTEPLRGVAVVVSTLSVTKDTYWNLCCNQDTQSQLTTSVVRTPHLRETRSQLTTYLCS